MKISINREYGQEIFSEESAATDPFTQFSQWFDQVLEAELLDANAMVVATVDEKGYPDSRVVLLKEFDAQAGLIFFTDYNSPKSTQAEKVGVVALNFYWREFARQVRVRGTIKRISRQASNAYFASRSRKSQISTAASKQSTVITRTTLEAAMDAIDQQYADQPIPCPDSWGGFAVQPFEFEFFQGRDNRVNDRLRYRLYNNAWIIERLSP